MIGILVGLAAWSGLGATADAPRFAILHLDEKAQKPIILNTALIAAVLPENRGKGGGGSWVFVSGARTFEVHESPDEIARMMR